MPFTVDIAQNMKKNMTGLPLRVTRMTMTRKGPFSQPGHTIPYPNKEHKWQKKSLGI